MHLRTKLTLGILVATFATFLAVGIVAIPTAKVALRDRIDDRLRADLPQVRASMLSPDGGVVPGALDPGAVPDDRGYALVVLDGSTARVISTPGPADAPDLSGLTDPPRGDEVAYAQATDGATYRYATVDLGDGRLLAVAAPVDDITALVDELIFTFSVIGVSAAAALAVLSWWWIRHSTRPIERLTERADAVANGDTDRSLAVPTSTAELRQLTRALDAMIASTDAALAVRARSEARLREFIANASHELRTPLTSVSGYLQLDVDGALDDPAQHRRSMGRALAEAARMRRIVADLQLLTELDEDLSPVTSDVDTSDLLRDAVHDMTIVDPTRAWTLSSAHERLIVAGDADQLRQVIANLLDNVRIHTPPGTITTVRASRQGDSVVIAVSDDGPGLPDDELARVFDRFWRNDQSRSRASGGSGLGLSIVAAIVAAHRGTVEASRTPGGGLTIRVALPQSGRASTSPDSDPSHRAPRRAETPRAATARSSRWPTAPPDCRS